MWDTDKLMSHIISLMFNTNLLMFNTNFVVSDINFLTSVIIFLCRHLQVKTYKIKKAATPLQPQS